MSYIDKIRDRLNIRPVTRGRGRDVSHTTDLPLDHQLTFKRNPGEEWQYRNGHLFVNNTDIEDILDYESRDVELWCAISEALVDYKDEVLRRGGKNKSKFITKITSVQDKVLINLKRLYDEKTDGIYLSFGDGELLFNNFNVRAFLAMYHLRPTIKAKKFLMGLKSKLALILVNRNGTAQYERVHRVIQQLYHEVSHALEIPTIETRCLPADSRRKSA